MKTITWNIIIRLLAMLFKSKTYEQVIESVLYEYMK